MATLPICFACLCRMKPFASGARGTGGQSLRAVFETVEFLQRKFHKIEVEGNIKFASTYQSASIQPVIRKIMKCF